MYRGRPLCREHAQGVRPSMVKSNVSWVMVTRDFPPSTDEQTRLTTSPSRSFIGGLLTEVIVSKDQKKDSFVSKQLC